MADIADNPESARLQSPLERAKAAIAQTLGYSDHPIEAFALVDGRMVSAEAIARAVIAAIREPDEAMQKAGVLAPNYLEDQSSQRGCTNIYTAMIDAILAGGE